ncbi:MAG: alpha/beta fold hydrolase [Pseudomonadales bacterium]
MASLTALKVRLPGADITLSAELMRPDDAFALLVLAHGAGADYRHASMVAISDALARHRVASLRFNFPFMEQGRRRVDGQAVSVATLLAALDTAREAAPELPVFLGGHSYGGRMASHAAAEHDLSIRGLVFCAFPLHPPQRPGTERAAHLIRIALPMLFLSGTRDALAEHDLLEEVLAGLGGRARLHWLDTADHGYKILKRSRRSTQSVFDELAEAAAEFMRSLV